MYNGSSSKFGGLPLFSLADRSNNAQLKPERTTAQEGGLEMSVLDDRLTIDGTYYLKKTRDQIIPLTTAPATGFSSAVINAGQISNRGFEASVTARPIRVDEWLQLEHDVQLPEEQEPRRFARAGPGDDHHRVAVELEHRGAAGTAVRRAVRLRVRARLGHRPDAAVRRSPDA